MVDGWNNSINAAFYPVDAEQGTELEKIFLFINESSMKKVALSLPRNN